jgi:transcriptional regulator with XRE-family HTH domain
MIHFTNISVTLNEKKFGRQVRKTRLEENLSQEELSFKAHLNRTYIGSVESGEKNITIRSMEKIANGLHASLVISLIKK